MKKILSQLVMILTTAISTVTHSQSSPPFCTDLSRECVLSAASSYLQALLSHDPSQVPFAENAQRFENGILTGESGEAMRDEIKNNRRLNIIHGIREVRWIVDGNQAIAFYLLDMNVPHSQIHVSTTHISERFQIENGRIIEIEAIFCNSFGRTPETSKILPPTSLSFLCNRI